MILTAKVNCKINLGLYVVRKRPDGYHDLETVFYPTDFYTDELALAPSDCELDFVCTDTQAGPPADNLCVRAFHLLRRDFDIGGVQIALRKHIPTGAGLGGGSADAAFTLKLLAQWFHLPLAAADLKAYAANLGSDVPFFIDNTPVFATGRGEIMTPVDLDLSNYIIKIVKPDFSVSTREAYAHITPKKANVDLKLLVNQPVEYWKELMHNDFEDSVFARHPELAALKRKMYAEGALYASMSGSGTAIYGIFTKRFGT